MQDSEYNSNMQDIIPLWKSHYSFGRSILTLEKKGTSKGNEPKSIIDIAVKNGLKEVCLVEDNLASYLEAVINTKEAGLKLIFGLKIPICNDISEKNENSLKKVADFIIFIRNKSGYEKLINLYRTASKDGFYYNPRLDFKILGSVWSDEDLILAVPFYDSFIHNNNLKGYLFCPNFEEFGIKPIFFIEDNDIPIDDIIKQKVLEYTKDKYKIFNAKTIYYENRKDFMAYATFRCIKNRSSLDMPDLEHFCSEEFCFESFKEKLNNE